MKAITIMMHWGAGEYAWEKDAVDDTTYVGGDIADAVDGFKHSSYMVSAALEADFADWAEWFEREAAGDALRMDWDSFNRQGLDLARRLKAELGDQVRVVYDKPIEDPGYVPGARAEVRTEILADGTLNPITLRRVAPTG